MKDEARPANAMVSIGYEPSFSHLRSAKSLICSHERGPLNLYACSWEEDGGSLAPPARLALRWDIVPRDDVCRGAICPSRFPSVFSKKGGVARRTQDGLCRIRARPDVLASGAFHIPLRKGVSTRERFCRPMSLGRTRSLSYKRARSGNYRQNGVALFLDKTPPFYPGGIRRQAGLRVSTIEGSALGNSRASSWACSNLRLNIKISQPSDTSYVLAWLEPVAVVRHPAGSLFVPLFWEAGNAD